MFLKRFIDLPALACMSNVHEPHQNKIHSLNNKRNSNTVFPSKYCYMYMYIPYNVLSARMSHLRPGFIYSQTNFIGTFCLFHSLISIYKLGCIRNMHERHLKLKLQYHMYNISLYSECFVWFVL